MKTQVFSALIDTIDLSQLSKLDSEGAREEIRDIEDGRIDEFVDGELTKSRIVQCLMNAAEAHAANSPDEPWHLFYADYLLGLRQTDMTTKHSPA